MIIIVDYKNRVIAEVENAKIVHPDYNYYKDVKSYKVKVDGRLDRYVDESDKTFIFEYKEVPFNNDYWRPTPISPATLQDYISCTEVEL